MLKFLRALVYSHVWIALCASAMVAQTFHHFDQPWKSQPLVWLTLGSTLFIYAIHRIVGLNQLKALNFELNQRYVSIESSRLFVLIFGLAGGCLSILAFFKLQWTTQLYLTLPALISILYVSPILSNNRRLRDIGVLKIFLISMTYAMVSVVLVAIEINKSLDRGIGIMFLEKFIFVLAITIPIDIRDLKIDALGTARTIPMLIGFRKSIGLALGLICIANVIVWVNPLYNFETASTLTICYFITALLIAFVRRSRTELYYSFGLDGTMILQSVAILTIG